MDNGGGQLTYQDDGWVAKYYDAANGELLDDAQKDTIVPYGKTSEANAVNGSTGTAKNNIIKVALKNGGTMEFSWYDNAYSE